MATSLLYPRRRVRGPGKSPKAGWLRLHNERRKRKLTQRQAAVLCGVTQQTFSAWEKATNRPNDKNWSAIAIFLNISLSKVGEEIAHTFVAKSTEKNDE